MRDTDKGGKEKEKKEEWLLLMGLNSSEDSSAITNIKLGCDIYSRKKATVLIIHINFK